MTSICCASSSFRGISALFLAGILGSTFASANLTIVPTFDSSITGNANAALIESTINQAITMYNQRFTDPITVNITFRSVTSGLGSNNPTTITIPYTTFRAALVADASTATDATALAHLPNQSTNPVTGGPNVVMSRANARALGLSASVSVDDVINLNTGLCFLGHANPQPGLYDLYAVTCHELDEALGTVSGVGGSTPWSADMYRYDSLGNRSYTTSTGVQAFLSVDGTTDIVEYNQLGRTAGDYGDWIHHNPNPQIQDWSGSQNTVIDMGPSEFTLLDAVGYDYAPVPEPASMTVLGLGALAVIRRRRK